MNIFRKISIKRQLIIIVVIITCITVVIGFVLQVIETIDRTKSEFVRNGKLISQLVGEYCVPALDFGFPERADEILNSLKNLSEINSCRVYNNNNELFASYLKENTITSVTKKPNANTQNWFNKNILMIHTPIIYKEKVFGSIYLEIDTKLSVIIFNQIGQLTLILIGLLVLSLFLAFIFERIISNPILNLAAFSEIVGQSGDYSMRVPITGNNEIATLYQAFNLMLEMLQKRELETKQTFDELTKSESKYRRLTENAKDLILRYNIKKRNFEYLSPAVESITGYTPNEFYTNPGLFDKLIHPEWKEQFMDMKTKMVFGKIKPIYEFQIFNKQRELKWIGFRNVIVNDQNNVPEFLESIVIDITQRKEAEEILLVSENRLNYAIAATNDGLWDWDIKTGNIFFNPQFFRMLGYKPEELEHNINYWKSIVYHEDIEKFINIIENYANSTSKNPFEAEYRIITKRGNLKWILIRGKAVEWNNEGRITRIVGTHVDIDFRKKAEIEIKTKNEEYQSLNEELRTALEDNAERTHEIRLANQKLSESEQKFKQLADNIDDIFWLKEDDKFIFLNNAFDNIWPVSRRKIFENQSIIEEYIHPDDLEKYKKSTSISNLKKNDKVSLQYRIKRQGQPYRWLWLKVYPVYNEDGTLIRIAGIESDITEQKTTEQALIIAKEKAQESDKLKTSFLANVSHEVRTPMNGIIGFSSLLKENNISKAESDMYIDIINKSSNQLLNIIEDIVEISKLETNQAKIYISNVNINILIDNLLLFFSNQKVTKNIELSVYKELTNQESIILTDENRLRQILSNLVSNSLKYTKEGYIKIGYKIQDPKFINCNKAILFFVEDSGIGIPHDKHQLIFERFRQASEQHAKDYGGTGLGLSISKGLVELLGGKIWLKSEPDKGSVFYFELPFSTEKNNLTLKTQETGKETTQSWNNKTILIIEDDINNYLYINALLKSTNIKILHTKFAEEGITIFEENKSIINLILMDIRLPGMNGYEATREIRQKDKKTPIIAQTAYAMEEDKLKCIEAGCNDYISKPINPDNLFSVLKNYL